MRAPAAADLAAAGSVGAAAVRAAPTIVGGEGTGEFGGGGGASVKGAILQVDGVLYVTAPDNVWALDARDGRLLWQYFWKTKGGTHIGNRGAGAVAQLPVLRDARQLPRLARREDRQGALARRDRGLQPAVLLHHGADRRRRSRAGRHRQRPRRPGVPAVVRSGDRQAEMDLLHRADEAGRSRASTPGRTWRRRVTAAGRSGFPASTIRRPSCTSSAPAIRRPATRASAARGTTSSPARSSRSTSTPARWPGTTRRRRTIRTTGTRRRRPS